MKAYRLALAAHAKSAADALSGVGGLYAAGRWHQKGSQVVYAAQSVSLAALERFVHLKRVADVKEHVYYEIDIPDALIEVPVALPSDWDAEPPRTGSREFGQAWLLKAAKPALRVPSVIVRDEFNVMLNPRHPDFDLRWVVRGPVSFVFDTRLLKLLA